MKKRQSLCALLFCPKGEVMKKILSLVCLLTLILPLLFGCSSSLSVTETEEALTKETVSEKTEEVQTGDNVYPETFSVGFSMTDITGQTPIAVYGGVARSVHDPLYLTCVAVWDGEKTALIMTADLKKMLDPVAEKTLDIIKKNFDISAENVILSCTHSHSAPDAGESGQGNDLWLAQYYQKLPKAIEAALRDLAPVKGAYTGKSEMEEGVTFVRRYLMKDGSYQFNPQEMGKVVEHESEPDREMRTIRFEREGKKDVLMVNFQTHYGGADTIWREQLSADFVDPFRDQAGEEFNCHVAYFSGAGGNINFYSQIPGEKKYPSFLEAVENGFIPTLRDALNKEEKAEIGKIHAQRSLYEGRTKQDTEERKAQAKEIASYGTSSAMGTHLIAKYGFDGEFDAFFTAVRANLGWGETHAIPLCAITFGDFSFVSTPYEMFDTNGKQVRDESPFDTTFVCTLAGGANGYVPSAQGYQNGSYETYNCRFEAGSGEEFAGELVRLLKVCKDKQ